MSPPPPPPPSQAGKFKPRKPARRVRVGGDHPVDAPPPAAPVVVQSHPRGGRGRGGRGGRTPVPMGRAFFTATPSGRGGTPATARKVQAAATATRTGVHRALRETEASEEVVGMLEEAVGSSSVRPTMVGSADLDGLKEGRYEYEDNAMDGSFGRPGDDTGFLYDSDSSAERRTRQPRRMNASGSMPPSSLPFPSLDVPPGIGNLPKPDFYLGAATDRNTHPPESSGTNYGAPRPAKVQVTVTQDAPTASPFVDTRDARAWQNEKDSWFLVQFPTRLPPLVQRVATEDAVTANVKREDGHSHETADEPSAATGDASTTYADVATAPVDPTAFDNAWANAVPGRLGKLVVYKSGRTVLVLERPDGSVVHMNAHEGLTCGFRQQAVVIDQKKNQYVTMGDVQKTIVMTPDLAKAFPDS